MEPKGPPEESNPKDPFKEFIQQLRSVDDIVEPKPHDPDDTKIGNT